jgi:hypothetical protein
VSRTARRSSTQPTASTSLDILVNDAGIVGPQLQSILDMDFS